MDLFYDINESPKDKRCKMESKVVKKKDKAGPSKRTKILPDGLNADEEKRFDEFLDDTAEKYNVSRRLGKQIVKNIIASEESGKLLKVAIGLADASELPEQKLTRSKSKVTVPLKPVDIPKLGGRAPNFLYVTDFGNEEEDADFVVDELEEVESSSSGESSEEELEEEEDEREIEQELEELAKSPELAFDRADIWVNPLSKDVNLNSVAVDHLADTNRELYIQLLERDWNEADEDYFEANDPDYNYEEEEKEEEPDIYEGFTHKLAVPRRECQLLLEEAYYDKVDINEEKKRIKEEGKNPRRPRRNQKAVKTAAMPSDGSCSLLKPGPYTFQPEEVEQMTQQLEQHVQHLIQTFVLCSHDEKKRDAVDCSLAMFNELNAYDIEAQQQGKKSYFNISNLCTGINTIHDILAIPKVPDHMVQWQNAPAPAGYLPRPEACLALMRSEALLYPELVPIVQPHDLKRLDSRWSPAEETLLLLGLIQFGYLRNSTQTFTDGRYYQIHRNLLPSRTPSQICNHMSAFRKSNRPNRIQELILKAEDENPLITFEFVKHEKFPMTMDRWPEDKRPCWYDAFQKKFYCMGNSIYSRDSLTGNTVVLPNNVTLMVKGPDGSLQPLQDGIIVINAPAQNGEMSTVQLQMGPVAVPVTSTSSAPIPPDPVPTPPAASTVTSEENSQDSQENEPFPEPEEFVDIEAVSSPEEQSAVESTETSQALAPTVSQQEIDVHMKENEPGPNQTKEVPTVNKRKLRTPVKITVPVKKKKVVRKTDERKQGEQWIKIDQLREDLAMSDDSESVISPQKMAHLRQKRSYLDSIQPGPSSGGPSGSKFEQFQFADMSRDMPMLQPLEIVLPEDKNQTTLENYIPMTPRCRTPSEGSISVEEIEELEPSPTHFSEYSVPNTPRDDNDTHSPTLLKMDPAIAQTFLERVEVHGAGKRNLFPTDFSHLHRPQESYAPPYSSLPCSSWDPGNLQMRHRRPPTIITLTEEPSKKWRKRTRQEKMNDGREGMMDPFYRQKQEQLLCKHIHSDIKKRLTLRRDLYSKVKEVFKKYENRPRTILKETYDLLHTKYPEVFGLIACLFPEEALPEEANDDKYRKAYRESLDMLMAIDAYTQRAKYKNNKNSKSLFRLMMSFCSEELSPNEFGEKMRDLFSDAPPLWNLIKTKLPVMYEDRVPQDQAEYVDLSLPSTCFSPNSGPPPPEVNKFQEALSSNAEVVDLCHVLGPHPPKQRNKLHIHNGHFYVNNGTNFTMVEAKRKEDPGSSQKSAPSKPVAKEVKERPAEPVKKPERADNPGKIENPGQTSKRKSTPKKKPPVSTWTKELDMKIITAYNSIDEENDDAVIDSLVPSLPFPRDQISQRLKFLLSLLISK